MANNTPNTAQKIYKNYARVEYIVRSDFMQEVFFICSDMQLAIGTRVVCQAPYGLDILSVIGTQRPQVNSLRAAELVRIATDEDEELFTELLAQAAAAEKVFRQVILNYAHLGMKLITAHIMLDKSKIGFLFTAEERVDFRDLVKDLSSKLQMRIELWQIGSREESRILGGLAICGREYCCHNRKCDIGSVTMKMLKEQSLTPNSSKLSGACGRLFCCLGYEHQQYIEEKRFLPKLGALVMVNDQKWHIKELNIMIHRVVLQGDADKTVTLSTDDLAFDEEKSHWYVVSHNLGSNIPTL